MVTWHRPAWRRLKTFQEFNLAINPEELLPQRLAYRPQPTANETESQSTTLEEGCLDLGTVKEITIGSRNHEYDTELLAAGRRYGLTHIESCVSIMYGSTLSDNRVLCLLCPPMLCRVWYVCLNWIIRGIKRQQKLADRSMLWLKEQYIQLYFGDGTCNEPLAADAIHVFGGRDWSNIGGNATAANSLQASETIETFKRESSIKFKKKRSVVNLLAQATQSGSSGDSDGRDGRDFRGKGSDRKRGDRMDLMSMATATNDALWNNAKHFRLGSITYDTQLDFLDFISLFRSFR